MQESNGIILIWYYDKHRKSIVNFGYNITIEVVSWKTIIAMHILMENSASEFGH